MKNKDFKNSIGPLEEALKKEPKNIGIYNSLGTSYMALERYDDAIKCYQTVIGNRWINKNHFVAINK